MASGYRPLGGYSPSLQPSVSPGDIADTEQLNLDEQGYARPSSTSRPNTPPTAAQNTSYNNYRYGGGYGDPPHDVEAEGLIKEEMQFQQPENFRLYKRRWIGLAVLTLHSFAVGWSSSAPAVVAETASKWYGVSLSDLNYISIISDIVFVIPAPFCIWVLNRGGPKWSLIIAAFFTAVGNWVIFAGAKTHNFDVNVAGSMIHSMASAFSLTAPTRYSRQWFDDKGRTFAIAIPTLAELFGAGFGAAIGAYMVKPLGPFNYDIQALIIAIVLTLVAIPVPFIPGKPPTPPSLVASQQSLLNFKESIKSLLRNKPFYLQLVTFVILAGTIETATSVTTQALLPYGYTQANAGDALSILVFVGIAAALIMSPILDKWKKHELILKIFSVIIAIAFTVLPWIPETRSVPALFAIFAIIGAFSISMEPALLEYQASGIHPVSPEFASVITICAVKLNTALLIYLVGKVLDSKKPEEGQPSYSLLNGFILMAGLLWVAAACTMLNGIWIFKRPAAAKVKGNL